MYSTEIRCSKLQYDSYLISGACSKAELSISGSLVDQENGRSQKKLKLLIEVPNEAHVKVHILSYNMILFSFP